MRWRGACPEDPDSHNRSVGSGITRRNDDAEPVASPFGWTDRDRPSVRQRMLSGNGPDTSRPQGRPTAGARDMGRGGAGQGNGSGIAALRWPAAERGPYSVAGWQIGYRERTP